MEDFLADLDNELNGNDTGNNPVKKVEDDNGAKSVEIKKDFLRNNWKPSNQKRLLQLRQKKYLPHSQNDKGANEEEPLQIEHLK